MVINSWELASGAKGDSLKEFRKLLIPGFVDGV